MADVVTTQVLENGPRHLVLRFTDDSDGTGETHVLKVDALDPANGWVIQGQTIVPGTDLKVTKAAYAVRNMGLRIQWQSTSSSDMLVLGGFGTLDFRDIGGLANPMLTGATGSILFTTVQAIVGASYMVDLYMTKGTGFPVTPGGGGGDLIELQDGSGVWLWQNGDAIEWG